MNDDRGEMDRDREHVSDELDDRLLALALGLDDDPELRADVERSPQLARRLKAIQDDLVSVEDGLQAMVPDQPEDWADLSHERWAKLQPFVETEQAARDEAEAVAGGRRARRAGIRPEPARAAARRDPRPFWRRWQAVAPAAIAVLAAAVVFGVVAGRDALQMNDDRAVLDSAPLEKDATGSSSAAEGAAAPADAGATQGLLVSGADDYQTVVVAVAGPVDGQEQPYSVERVLKGTAGDTVSLQTELDGELEPGTRALLFLDPRGELAGAGEPTVTPEGDQRADDAADGEAEGGGAAGGVTLRPAPHVYLQNGETAVVVPLPADFGVDAIRLE